MASHASSSLGEFLNQRPMGPFGSGGVAIVANVANVRKYLGEFLGHPLGATAKMLEIGRTTGGAGVRMRSPHSTIVTAQVRKGFCLGVVIGEGYITIGTVQHMAAAATGDKRTVPPTMNKQNALLARFPQPSDGTE